MVHAAKREAAKIQPRFHLVLSQVLESRKRPADRDHPILPSSPKQCKVKRNRLTPMNLTTVILAVALLFLIVLLGGGLIVYIYWWLVQRPAPQLEGELDLPELDATVEILRGPPRHPPCLPPKAKPTSGAPQGFTHAQDRLWQMELNRRVARGRLAELFGEAALDVDRFSRIVGFHRAAQAELDALDEATIAVMRHYCQGVNAYIRSRKGKLAAEFNLLRRQPEEWSPVDILAFGKMMSWSLNVNWESELVRLQLAAKLDPDARLRPGAGLSQHQSNRVGRRRQPGIDAAAPHRRPHSQRIRTAEGLVGRRVAGVWAGKQCLGRLSGKVRQRPSDPL